MEFSRQEYWSGLPFHPPGDLPDPGIEPLSPKWQADSLPLSHLGSPVDCIGEELSDGRNDDGVVGSWRGSGVACRVGVGRKG